MNSKKIALIALLIAVIAVAAVIAVKRARSELKATNITLLVDQKFEKIDMKTFEVFAETNADWQSKYAPDASRRYKNPKTGEYTMVGVMKCALCGQPIPVPQNASEFLPKREPGQPKASQTADSAIALAMQKALSDYICPRCGKHASLAPAPAPKSKSAQPGQQKSKSPQAG